MSEQALDIARLAHKELELQAKGYTPEQAEMAVRRAQRYARQLAEKTPVDVRERVYESLLEDQLLSSEAWLDGLARAARSGKYERRLQEAAEQGRWKEGIDGTVGGEGVSQEIADRQAQGVLDQAEEWKRMMTGEPSEPA